MNHRARGFLKAGLAYVVASFLAVNYLADIGGEFGIGGAALHAAKEIMVGLREKAGANFSIRGEANTAAMPAEGTADRRDNADFTAAIGKGVTAGGLAGGGRW